MVKRFMLDTNMISYAARNLSARVRSQWKAANMEGPVFVSVITEAEILYGLAKRPKALRVAESMMAGLASLTVLPWNSAAVPAYAALRAENERLGSVVGALDMLIAAHALAEGAVLVTNDGALARLAGGPKTVNWADDLRLN